jgi:hypothetical protein
VLRRKTAQVLTLLKKKVWTWGIMSINWCQLGGCLVGMPPPLLECRRGNTDNDKRVQQGWQFGVSHPTAILSLSVNAEGVIWIW